MSIFRDTFKPGVQAQFTARQNAVSEGRSTPQSIQNFNARNAWIRMTSAVDVADDGGKLAKSYILQGGILNSNNGLREGLGGAEGKYMSRTQSGINYRLGIRPMPGITSIDVRSKSAYGSLREITVNFNAWDIHQLEELELLYMRPGYTALIEWGWSPYLDNNGNLQNIVRYYDDIFIKGKKKEDIWKEIFNKAQETGNYDAMYGKIQNYSWSARADGGYDCTTTITSIGEVIESLKVNYSALEVPNLEKTGIIASRVGITLDSEVLDSYMKNVVAGICHELYVVGNEKAKDFSEYKIVDKNNSNKEYLFYKFPVDISGGEENKEVITKNGKQVYITLESFIDILNKYVLLADATNKTPYAKFSVRGSDITSTNDLLLCLGNIYQLSTNPGVCLIANHAWEDPSSIGVPDSSDFSTLKKLMKGMSKDYFYEGDYKTKQLGVIGNIYLNLNYLYQLITNDSVAAQDKKEKNDIAIYDYIKNIMSGVSTAIGNVATFEIHVDPVDNNVAKIIDVNFADAVNRDKIFNNAFTLELHSTKSTTRNYKLESKIFPEQSTIVAIGAQAQGGALGADTNTLIDFNQNLIDRIMPRKDTPTFTGEADPIAELKVKVESLLKNVKVLITFITKLDSFWIFKGDYDAAKASDYSNALKDIIAFFRSFTKDDTKNRAIIPVKLSVTTDGIGGIVIGNIFKIPPDLLPRGYKGTNDIGRRLGYIVTGLGHSISNNDWTTTIDAQTIILDPPTDGISAIDFAAIAKISSSLKEAVSGNTTATQRLTEKLASIDPNQQPGPPAKDIPTKVNVDKVIAAMQKKGYSFNANTNFGKNKLNIVGVREANKAFNSNATNYFTDYIVMFYYDDKGARYERIGWQTTAPGLTYEAAKFGGAGRTIMMQEGQYKDAYVRGLHQGKVDTLVQAKTMQYHKDESLNAQYNSTNIIGGVFGTNIHPSGNYGNNDSNKLINNWSAGCQVFRSYDDYLWMMQAVRNQVEKTNYKFFTYTLLNIKDL